MFGFIAFVAAAIVIIRDKDGNKIAELKVPEGGKIEVTDETKTDPAKVELKQTTLKKDPPPIAENKDTQPVIATWKPVPIGQSPFDKLDPNAIPKEERFPWQPKELVAVIGEHKQRFWNSVGVGAIAVRPDEQQVAVFPAHNVSVSLFDATGRLQFILPGGGCRYTHDSKILLSRRAWDVTGVEPKRLDGPSLAIGTPGPNLTFYGSSLSKDGKLFLNWFGGEISTIALWDISNLANAKVLARIKDTDWGSASPDGKVIAAISNKDWRVRLFDWDGKEARPRPAADEKIFSPDTKKPNVRDIPAIAFHPDGRLGIMHADNILRLWDVSGPTPKLTAATPEPSKDKEIGNRIVFSPDGKLAATLGRNNPILWSVEGKRIERLTELDSNLATGSGGNPSTLAFFPSNKRIVTGHSNGVILYWEIRNDKVIPCNQLTPAIDRRKFGISADGRILARRGRRHISDV